MNGNEWTAVHGRLKAAGFLVSFERVSYAEDNPLWRANARRDGRAWTSLGKELGEALLRLETETQEPVVDWRAMIASELTAQTHTENLEPD